MKKLSLISTLFTITTVAFMVMTVGSSGLRGRRLQGINIEGSNVLAPSVKIAGVSTLLNILNAASNFTNSAFDVLTLDSFSQNLTDQGVVYDGKVTLANDQGFNVSGVINGTWDPSSGNLNFNVAGVETSGSEGEGQESGSNNTNATAPVAVPDGYTWIPAADLPNNDIAQGALTWGVNTLVAKAILQFKLPAADPQYNVTNLILAAYKTTGYGTAYIFWTNLANDLNYKMDANITVKYWKSTQNYTLAGYSFHSYGYPSSAIVIPPPVNTTTPNNTSNATDNSTAPSNGTVTVPDNSTSIPVNTTSPTDNTTVIVDNSTNSTSVFDNSTVVTPITPDNSTNVTIVVNNTTPTNTTNTTIVVNQTTPSSTTNTTVVVNQTTPDGYTIYTPDQLAADSQAQTALQYGANALIQKGISQNKIPAANPNYTVSNIELAAYKKQNVGTFYKFYVNMTNVDYVHVDANLTILYRTSTKAYSLNGYSFHSYNYSTKALSNGNGNGNAATSIPIANTTSATNTTTPVVADNSTATGSA